MIVILRDARGVVKMIFGKLPNMTVYGNKLYFENSNGDTILHGLFKDKESALCALDSVAKTIESNYLKESVTIHENLVKDE